MQRIQPSRMPATLNPKSGLQMSTIERARAEEGMQQAMALAGLTLAGVASVRHAFADAGDAMFLAFGRDRI